MGTELKKVAVVKLSSFGDLLHTLPTITDLHAKIRGVEITWIVDQSLAAIPAWHPGVARVIPVPLRQLKAQRSLRQRLRTYGQMRALLRQQHFDLILDLQGLWKSAWLARLSSGEIHGLGAHAIRERGAHWLYHRGHHLAPDMHVITRSRQLAAMACGYSIDIDQVNYGIEATCTPQPRSIFFAHGTTWQSKHWPDEHWQALAQLAVAAGFHIKLTYGNDQEAVRAKKIHQVAPGSITLIPKGSLAVLKEHLVQTQGIISVDTGLFHLACALGLPGLALFGASNPRRVSGLKPGQRYLASSRACHPCNKRQCALSEATFAPCLQECTPRQVLRAYQAVLAQVAVG
jgi:heptosyltransferase I